ncbi:MAG: hypothetical protein ACYDDS_03610 [Candidatus Sulfotelmatobacter sp.]
MKALISALLLMIWLSSSSSTSGQTRPRPPGLQQAEQADAQMEKSVPPPNVHRSAADAAKLEQEADELARLAQSIPPDIQTIRKGMFPKDVIQKLKHIEKLSRHLRGELAP